MENLENHDENELTPLDKQINFSFYLKVILAAVVLGGGYFAFYLWGDQLFTSGKDKGKNGLDQKNVIGTNGDLKRLDTAVSFNPLDTAASLHIENPLKTNTDSLDNKNALTDDPKSDSLLMRQKGANRGGILNKYSSDEAVFEALSPSNGASEKNRMLLNKFRSNQIISLETSLKLLSMAGLNILTNKKTEFDLNLFSLIKDQKNISNFYIVDKDGIIFYDAKTNMIYTEISNILDSIVLTSDRLEIGERPGQIVMSYPIYHSFGKIGFVVLIMKNDVN